jgi:hypothetical protein
LVCAATPVVTIKANKNAGMFFVMFWKIYSAYDEESRRCSVD